MTNPIRIMLVILFSLLLTAGCASKRPCAKCAKREKEKNGLNARREIDRRDDDEDIDDEDPLKRQLDKLEEQQALASALDPTQTAVPPIGEGVQPLPVPDPDKAANPFAQQGNGTVSPSAIQNPPENQPLGQLAQNPGVATNPAPVRALASKTETDVGPVARLQSLLEASTHSDDASLPASRRLVDE